jgi:nucleotide-binding universal stress UspA family protein
VVYKRILVPVDGSSTSLAGLKESLKLAKNQHAKLRLLHVVDEMIVFNTPESSINVEPILKALERDGKRLLRKAEKLALSGGIKPEFEMWESAGGRIADVIVDRARRWRADLIVMGTHGRRGMNRMLMGSDAELVVRNAAIPVLLVHGGKPGTSRGKRK